MIIFARCALLATGLTIALLTEAVQPAQAQEKSVRPGINAPFAAPDPAAFVEKFEIESREVYARRTEIVAACDLRPGMTVADIGAGTGLFTRLFAEKVGPEGRVISVDIALPFLEHIRKTSRELGQRNVETVLAEPDSTKLPPASVDLAFICDTYHHFEFPHKTMASIRSALKPGGRVVLVDFQRIPGESTEWVLEHVRAGREVFEQEILDAGFRKTDKTLTTLRENYFTTFALAAADSSPVPSTKLQFPLIAGYGGVVIALERAYPPRKGAKVVFDITGGAAAGSGKPNDDVNRGLDRVARLLNLYGAAGLSAEDVEIVVVLHGDATRVALRDETHRKQFDGAANPNHALLTELRKAGVRIAVCGQALHAKGFSGDDVSQEIVVATSALTLLIDCQSQGFVPLAAH